MAHQRAGQGINHRPISGQHIARFIHFARAHQPPTGPPPAIMAQRDQRLNALVARDKDLNRLIGKIGGGQRCGKATRLCGQGGMFGQPVPAMRQQVARAKAATASDKASPGARPWPSRDRSMSIWTCCKTHPFASPA
jgi:hypothetical protein